jgi:hypothetical protein
MKTFLTLFMGCVLLPFFLSSCASGKGEGWQFTSLATDYGTLDVTRDGFRATKMNQTTGFKQAVDLVQKSFSNYLLAAGLKYVTGKYYDNKNAEVSAATTVDLEKLRNAKSSADAAAALKTLEANHAAEAAATTITPL